MIDDLQERIIRALALKTMEAGFGQVTLLPEDIGKIDYQLAVKAMDDPPRLVVSLISRERLEELLAEGAPLIP